MDTVKSKRRCSNKKCGRLSFMDGRSISLSLIAYFITFHTAWGPQALLFISMQIWRRDRPSAAQLIPYWICLRTNARRHNGRKLPCTGKNSFANHYPWLFCAFGTWVIDRKKCVTLTFSFENRKIFQFTRRNLTQLSTNPKVYRVKLPEPEVLVGRSPFITTADLARVSSISSSSSESDSASDNWLSRHACMVINEEGGGGRGAGGACLVSG